MAAVRRNEVACEHLARRLLAFEDVLELLLLRRGTNPQHPPPDLRALCAQLRKRLHPALRITITRLRRHVLWSTTGCLLRSRHVLAALLPDV